jgi:hypothetical protein
MTRLLLFLILGLFIVNISYAQDKISGRIFEHKTTVALFGIKVENLKTHNTAVSDSTGRFSISANVGDYISFSGFAYQIDTVYIASLKYLEVSLEPKQNMLKEVKVMNTETKLGNLTAPPPPAPLGGQTVRYQTDGAGNETGGLKIMLFDSNSNEKKKERDHKIAADEDKHLEIYNIFKPKNLKNYVPITDTTEMDNFIILYTPDIATYYSSEFNLTVYLNDCYQKFLDIPEADRRSPTYLRLVTKDKQ